jgi:Ca-activated chloride channel family protein
MLTQAKTVIGGDLGADITIAGNPSIKDNAATILFDEAKGQYTIVGGGGEVLVNNKPVIKRKLESGDVINMAGTVVVFDEASKKTVTKKN